MSSNMLWMSINTKNSLPGEMGHGIKEIDPTTKQSALLLVL